MRVAVAVRKTTGEEDGIGVSVSAQQAFLCLRSTLQHCHQANDNTLIPSHAQASLAEYT